MSNNGLLCSNDVNKYGMPDSSYFLKKGEQLVIPSPLQIVSPDQSEVGTISVANNADMSVATINGNLSLNPGENKNVFINTDPAGSGDVQGIVITRPDANVNCSLNVPLSGQLEVETFTGAIDIRSSQAGPRAFLGVSPFSGQVTLSNPNDGADGTLALQCASATTSEVSVFVRPPVGASSGIKIKNINAGADSCTVNQGSDGVMILSATNNRVHVAVDGGSDGRGLLVKPINQTTGTCALLLQNGELCANPTRFIMFNSSETAGGLETGQFQIYGYSGAGLATVRQVLQANEVGSVMLIGSGDSVGGTTVNINGTLGVGRVFDTLYNRPGHELIAVYANDFTSSTAPTTFTIPATGRYMLELRFNYDTATISPGAGVTGFIKFGNPANAAQLVGGSANTATEGMLQATVGGGAFNVLVLNAHITLTDNVFEPNQRYAFATHAINTSGGLLDMALFRVD